MQKDSPKNITKERRADARSTKLRNYRIEIKFVGEPIYQFRLINVTNEGASILVKDDSSFLNLIEVGQIETITFISPKGSNPYGIYKIEVKHISKLHKQIYKGHQLVGISILEKLDQTDSG